MGQSIFTKTNNGIPFWQQKQHWFNGKADNKKPPCFFPCSMGIK
jgi:hypothetical protein